MKWLKTILLVTIFTNSIAFAETAKCKIKIEDVKKGTTQRIEENIAFKTGGPAHRKHFEIPRNDYKCTLAFFDLNSGTMISCEYTKDMGMTYFQSDRSDLKESPKSNRLSFRHGKSHISLNAECM